MGGLWARGECAADDEGVRRRRRGRRRRARSFLAARPLRRRSSSSPAPRSPLLSEKGEPRRARAPTPSLSHRSILCSRAARSASAARRRRGSVQDLLPLGTPAIAARASCRAATVISVAHCTGRDATQGRAGSRRGTACTINVHDADGYGTLIEWTHPPPPRVRPACCRRALLPPRPGRAARPATHERVTLNELLQPRRRRQVDVGVSDGVITHDEMRAFMDARGLERWRRSSADLGSPVTSPTLTSELLLGTHVPRADAEAAARGDESRVRDLVEEHALPRRPIVADVCSTRPRRWRRRGLAPGAAARFARRGMPRRAARRAAAASTVLARDANRDSQIDRGEFFGSCCWASTLVNLARLPTVGGARWRRRASRTPADLGPPSARLRSWHASFNQWLVRPLRRAFRVRCATSPVFSPSSRCGTTRRSTLLWGALLPAGFAPELAATAAAARTRRAGRAGYRHPSPSAAPHRRPRRRQPRRLRRRHAGRRRRRHAARRDVGGRRRPRRRARHDVSGVGRAEWRRRRSVLRGVPNEFRNTMTT